MGSVWFSAMPSVVTKQYAETQYGAVVGVMAQQQVLAVLPAYPLTILFAYTLQTNSTIKWPGIVWFFAAFFLLLAILMQIHAHPGKALTLARRAKFVVTPEVEGTEKDLEKDSDVIPIPTINPLLLEQQETNVNSY
jgi:hypothetical protein